MNAQAIWFLIAAVGWYAVSFWAGYSLRCAEIADYQRRLESANRALSAAPWLLLVGARPPSRPNLALSTFTTFAVWIAGLAIFSRLGII